MSSIIEIIKKCGGELMVAYHLPVNPVTVKRWRKSNHIPEKYWRRLAELGKMSVQSIEAVHKKAKRK